VPRDPESFRLVEKLLLLTHMAIRAVEEAEVDEVGQILDQRAEVVSDLQGRELDQESAHLFERVRAAERSLEARLKNEMDDSVRQLHTLYLERRGHKAYRAA